MLKQIMLLSAISLGLVGCEIEEESDEKSLSTDDIKTIVQQTNINATFPDRMSEEYWRYYGDPLVTMSSSPPGNIPEDLPEFIQTGIVRWDTTSAIPVYYVSRDGGEVNSDVEKGVRQLEDRLGNIFTSVIKISEPFVDQATFLSNPADYLRDFYNRHGINYGIVIGMNLVRDSGSSQLCASAAGMPYATGNGVPVETNTHLVSKEYVGWVNIGESGCSWDEDWIKHEMSHLLGLYEHFEDQGFGLWSDNAMDVVATIYSNPAGTAPQNLTVSK